MKRVINMIVPLIIGACSVSTGHSDESHRDTHGTKVTTDNPKAEDVHADHEHGDNESSDLNRPVEALFADRCEHDIFTYECDECRYEVGVVKVSATLMKEGLIQVVSPQRSTVAVPLLITGKIQFDERRIAKVSSQVAGSIGKVHVTLGDEVSSGQPLLEIESAEVGHARAAYLEAQAMETLAKRTWERLKALQVEGVSSEKEMLQAKRDLDMATIRSRAARGILGRFGIEPGSGKQRDGAFGRLVLRSPVDGKVLQLQAVSGELTASDVPLLTIGDNGVLWVWGDVYEMDYPRVRTAMQNGALDATVRTKAFPGESFSGVVDFIRPSMSDVSRTVKVRIALPNPEERLLSGMFAKVELLLSEARQAIVLPSGAVMEDAGRRFVFVQRDPEYFVRRPVKTGESAGGNVEIVSGVMETDVVVANGAFLLKSDVLRAKMGAGCAH